MVAEKFFKEYNKTQGFLAIALIIFFLYLGTSTNPVPNYNNETGTVSYGIDDVAPPAYVSNEQIVIGIVLVIALFFSFKIKDIQRGRVSERIFKENITREIQKKQNVLLPNGKYELPKGDFEVNPHLITRFYTPDKGERYAVQYVAQATITEEGTGEEKYFYVTGSPVTSEIDDFIPTKEAIKLSDKCPDCGKFFSEKFVGLDQYKKMKDIFGK